MKTVFGNILLAIAVLTTSHRLAKAALIDQHATATVPATSWQAHLATERTANLSDDIEGYGAVDAAVLLRDAAKVRAQHAIPCASKTRLPSTSPRCHVGHQNTLTN